MADTEMPQATLVDELAGLDPQARRTLATTLRNVSETFAEVPDGRHSTHTHGLRIVSSRPLADGRGESVPPMQD